MAWPGTGFRPRKSACKDNKRMVVGDELIQYGIDGI